MIGFYEYSYFFYISSTHHTVMCFTVYLFTDYCHYLDMTYIVYMLDDEILDFEFIIIELAMCCQLVEEVFKSEMCRSLTSRLLNFVNMTVSKT